VLLDRHARPLRNLRLSVTDRCNIRCSYCMPEADYAWLPRQDILDFEEVERVVDAFVSCGVDRVRLTGGEPLLRRDLPLLVEKLARRTSIADLALTTNGILLAGVAARLRDAGLARITISLDTLHPARFKALTRSDDHGRVLQGIDAAVATFRQVKIDTVVIRQTNHDELLDILEFGRQRRAEVRFIEYMDVGGATHWSMAQVVGRDEILATIADRHGIPVPLGETSSAPAVRYRLPDGTIFGIIASTTAPFCADCDRSRLTADGMWYLCLYAAGGLDLKGRLRAGASPEEMAALIQRTWQARADRGAEQRLAIRDRSPLIPVDSLRRDPHLEMHTRGG
jgi:cyclic pyranopterin phosphate synthase